MRAVVVCVSSATSWEKYKHVWPWFSLCRAKFATTPVQPGRMALASAEYPRPSFINRPFNQVREIRLVQRMGGLAEGVTRRVKLRRCEELRP
jgi:hypothetical protein